MYRHFLIFLTLLQAFTFATKVGSGATNTTVLALLPSVYLGILLTCVFLLLIKGEIGCPFTLLDTLVLSFFVLDFIQIFNPYLGAIDDNRFFIIGLRGFQQRSFYGLVYFVIRWLEIPSFRFNTIIRIIVYTTALGSIYALMQQFFSFTILESAYQLEQIAKDPLMEGLYISRAIGFMGSPFTFGLISATGLVSGIYLYYSILKSKKERLLCIGSIIVNTAAVVISGSRSTYFSLIVIPVMLVVLMKTPVFSFIVRSLTSILALIVALSFFFIFFPDSIPVSYSIERMKTVNEIFSKETSDMNFILRRELVVASGPLILSNPLGYGTGIFNGGSNPDGLVKVDGYSTFMDNEFVGLALEMGILGVLLFIAIIGAALYRCHLAIGVPDWRNRARILAALIVICPAAGIGGQWLAIYPINICFWVFLSLIAGLPTSESPNNIYKLSKLRTS